MTDTEAIPTEDLIFHPRCQAREELSKDAIEEYADIYRAGRDLPPVDVFRVNGDLLVVDGFHRVSAAVMAGRGFVRARVVGEGTLDEASWTATRANRDHGVRRTSADKRRAVRVALDGIGAEQSNRVLADHVGVSHELVRKVRAEWEAEHGVETTERVGADGKRYPVNGEQVTENATCPEAPDRERDRGGDHAGASGESLGPPPAGGADDPEGGSPDGDEDPPSREQGEEPWTAEPMPEDGRDLEELAGHIRSARLLARKLLAPEGPRASLRQRVEDHLDRAEKACRLAVPVVCSECHGDGCKACSGRGWTDGTAKA